MNNAPSFVLTAPAETVFEGRGVTVHIRDMIDPEGDHLQFEVTQVSGPASPLLHKLVGRAPVYTFEAPSVSTPGGTETLIFEAAVTDRVNDPVTQQVTVTVRDNNQPGLPISHIKPGDRLFAEHYSHLNNRIPSRDVNLLTPIGLQADISKLAYAVSLDSFGFYWQLEGTIQFHSDDIVLFDPLWFNGVHRAEGPDLIVLSSVRDSLEWYTNEYTYDENGFSIGTRMYLAHSEPFIDPCTVRQRTSTGSDFAWVGLREGGVVVTEVIPITAPNGTTISFEQNRLQTLGEGRSICFIFPTELSNRYAPPNGNLGGPGLITVDFLNKELFIVVDADQDGIWEEVEVIPLDLAGNPNLEVVDAISTGSPSLLPRYIAILVSDGVDGGDHRLIIVAQDNDDREIFQETYQWSGGAPFKLLRGPFAGEAGNFDDQAGHQKRQDYVAISDTATGSVIIPDMTSPNSIAHVPIFGQPQSFPFMAGASSAVTTFYHLDGADLTSYPQFGILATFPDDQSLRFFGMRIE